MSHVQKIALRPISLLEYIVTNPRPFLQNVLQLLEDEKIAPDIVTYALLSLGCKSADDAKNYVYGMQNEGIKCVLISINFRPTFVDF